VQPSGNSDNGASGRTSPPNEVGNPHPPLHMAQQACNGGAPPAKRQTLSGRRSGPAAVAEPLRHQTYVETSGVAHTREIFALQQRLNDLEAENRWAVQISAAYGRIYVSSSGLGLLTWVWPAGFVLLLGRV
jgi:hypothetical protein